MRESLGLMVFGATLIGALVIAALFLNGLAWLIAWAS